MCACACVCVCVCVCAGEMWPCRARVCVCVFVCDHLDMIMAGQRDAARTDQRRPPWSATYTPPTTPRADMASVCVPFCFCVPCACVCARVCAVCCAACCFHFLFCKASPTSRLVSQPRPRNAPDSPHLATMSTRSQTSLQLASDSHHHQRLSHPLLGRCIWRIQHGLILHIRPRQAKAPASVAVIT